MSKETKCRIVLSGGRKTSHKVHGSLARKEREFTLLGDTARFYFTLCTLNPTFGCTSS